MAGTIVFDQDVTVVNGGESHDGFKVRIWAEQEGGTVSWYAQGIEQYYARTRSYYVNMQQYYYFDLGCIAVKLRLRVGSQISDEITVNYGASYGDNGSWSGAWTRTTHTETEIAGPILVSAPAERYDVSISYTGGLQGERTVQEGGGVSALLNVDGAIVPVAAVYANVDGSIVQPTVWGRVGDQIVSFGG